MLLNHVHNLVRIVLVSALVAGLATACVNESDSNPTDGGSAVTSFDREILPIFNNSCAGSGCHIGERTNGVRLDSYQNVTESRGALYGALIVDPGNAAGSPLVDKIDGGGQLGSRMPLGRAALSQGEITAISDWINRGALEDE